MSSDKAIELSTKAMVNTATEFKELEVVKKKEEELSKPASVDSLKGSDLFNKPKK